MNLLKQDMIGAGICWGHSVLQTLGLALAYFGTYFRSEMQWNRRNTFPDFRMSSDILSIFLLVNWHVAYYLNHGR